MGFFFQAIKKESGEPDTPASTLETGAVTPPVESVSVAPNGSGSAPAIAAIPALAVPSPGKRLRVQLEKKIEKLVAVLSPPLLDGHVAAMEECRVIRSRLREILREQRKKTVMLTSSSAEEGKTLLSVNLAFALSQLDSTRVLLVDADLRRPAVHSFLQMKSGPGLDCYLQGSHSLNEVCYEVSSKLHVVPTASVASDSAEMLHSERMQAFIAETSAKYDIVLIDAPPLFPIVDAQILGSIVDAAVLVVRADATPFELAAEASQMLKDKFVGTILNCGKRTKKNSYYESAYGKALQQRDK